MLRGRHCPGARVAGAPVPTEREEIETLRQNGQFAEALARLTNLMARTEAEGPDWIEDHWQLGLLSFVTFDFERAAAAFQVVRQRRPDDLMVAENLGLSLLRIGRPDAAKPELERALAAAPGKLNLLDGLADCCGQLGDMDAARAHGEAALHARDVAADDAHSRHDPAATRIPEFRADRPGQNVISFCLFGDDPKYRQGALRNAQAIPYIYPGWQARFYCGQDQPDEVVHALGRLGAKAMRLPLPERRADALFWRFQVLQDAEVSRYLIRDCDSVVTVRERVAVDEWLASERHFHVMRDHFGHTDLVLAGLWGGVAGALPPLAEMLDGFGYNPATESRTADQKFLRERVWPVIRQSCLIHDSLFRSFDARDFPAVGALPPGRHVGDNDFAARSA